VIVALDCALHAPAAIIDKQPSAKTTALIAGIQKELLSLELIVVIASPLVSGF
jgi:hypothetical protein